MKTNLLPNLLQALVHAPEDTALRMQVAGLLLESGFYEDAALQFQQLLETMYGDVEARLGLAACYTEQRKYSAALIIYEALQEDLPLSDGIRYVKCLLADGAIDHAVEVYQQMMAAHPGFYDDELDASLRLSAQCFAEETSASSLPEDELLFMPKPNLRFSDVAGLEEAKQEIALKIITPFKHPELCAAFGKKAGGSILLYGPPGCGKTWLAKATAGEVEVPFISIGLHEMLDMWIGNTEKKIHDVFEVARRAAPCVLFIDEIDAIGACRTDMKGHPLRNAVNQLMAELDGLSASNEGILVMAATNAPWHLDMALQRPGRFDRTLYIGPPDEAARKQLLKAALKHLTVGKILLQKVAAATAGFTGADIKAMVDKAAEKKLQESILKGSVQAIQTADLMLAAQCHRPNLKQWLDAAAAQSVQVNNPAF